MTRQIFACCTMSYFKRFWISRSLNYPFWGLNFSLGTKKPKSFGRAEENIVAPSHEVLNFLQSGTKLLEKVFPIMSTFLRNKTISKTTPLRKENPFPQFNVASHKRPGIRLSFEYTTTLLSGEGGEGRTGTATIFRKMLSKYTIFSTVLSKIVACSTLSNSRGQMKKRASPSLTIHKAWNRLGIHLSLPRKIHGKHKHSH